MARPIITLTTDFGQTDSYVGILKGVLLSLCPEAVLVDICHEIRPQAVRQAAYLLSTAVPYFPPGTVHLVVVDPCVGSERRPLVVDTGRALYVIPDNGVLSLVLRQEPARLAIHLTEPRYRLSQISATFHGRDIFAPSAAYLACGTALTEMGHPISVTDLTTLPGLEPQRQADGSWLGEVVHVDHFGNLVTNFQVADPGARSVIQVGATRIETLSRTFADVTPGQVVAYVGSSGHLEIAVREGNAAHRLDVDIGDSIRLEGWP